MEPPEWVPIRKVPAEQKPPDGRSRVVVVPEAESHALIPVEGFKLPTVTERLMTGELGST